jgi:uncharacterized membrane protein (UPF0127 family)
MRFTRPATLHTGLNANPVCHVLCLRVAQNSWSRFRGLMLTARLQTEPATQALLITRCPSVHGFFMRYAVDVVYLAKAHTGAQHDAAHYTVTHTTTLKPWRISFGRSRVADTPQGRHTQRSAHALEMPAGSIQRMQIRAGDKLVVQP